MKAKVQVMFIVAIISLMTAFSSLAETWEKDVNGFWICYDDDGELITNGWAKSGDNWYRLDENGHMVTDTLIDDNGKKAYVDSNGVLISNMWVLDGDFTMYYMDENGYAIPEMTKLWGEWDPEDNIYGLDPSLKRFLNNEKSTKQTTDGTTLPPESDFELIVIANHNMTDIIGDINSMLAKCSTAEDFLNAMYSSNRLIALLSNYCDSIISLTSPYAEWNNLEYLISQVKESLPAPLEQTINLSDAQAISSAWFNSLDKSLDYMEQFSDVLATAPYAR